MPRSSLLVRSVAALVLTAAATACGSSAEGGAGDDDALTVRLYTSVTQETVDAVTALFEETHPGARVELFRAPTGDLNARIAADERSGGIRADVIWGTDPLSMHSYVEQDLLREWPAADLTDVPEEFRTEFFWGTRQLYIVMAAHEGFKPAPESWADLTDPAYRDAVALPDPAFAGSAFAALGYFAQEPGYGLDFYRQLKENGAEQVASIPEVVTGVAEGRYQVGITLDSEVRGAVAAGSPVTLVWPEPGAIALYSPIGATVADDNAEAANQFIRTVLSPEGQRAIAGTGWQPVIPGIEGPEKPAGAQQVSPDWSALFGRQQDLLQEYQTIYER